MSDQREVPPQAGELIKELLKELKESIVAPHRDEVHGGLFPKGVNDIYVNVTVGTVKIEAEVSASGQVGPRRPGIEERVVILNHLHPAVVSNTSDTGAYVLISRISAPGYTDAPHSTVTNVPIGGAPGQYLVAANLDQTQDVYVKAASSYFAGSTFVNAHGGFLDIELS